MPRPNDGRGEKRIAEALRGSFLSVPEWPHQAPSANLSRSSKNFLSVALFLAALSFGATASATSGNFYTVTPCRVIDTRGPVDPFGGPALAGGVTRSVSIASQCLLPPTASAVSINITVTGSSADGYLSIFPAGTSLPNVSVINYRQGQTRANNAVIPLGNGSLAVFCGQASGTTHFLIDVNGYFDDPVNNQPPTVTVGPPQTAQLTDMVSLTGSVTDDGLPFGQLTYGWSKVAGQGTPSFKTPGSPSTTVTFNALGNYVLRLTASDGSLTSWQDVRIIVNPPGNTFRFVQQATFGATDTLVNHVNNVGYVTFLDEQIAMPPSSYPTLAPEPDNVPATCDSTCQRDKYSMYPLQNRFFTNALYADDQLRQKVAWALHQLIVISGQDVTMPSRFTPYLQAIDRNVFGNFRQLLSDITLNPAMGVYLDMATSTKNNPNENYAREILQLFSVGTDILNIDGSPVLGTNGDPVPTYDQTVVSGFAKVFTGWSFATRIATGVTNYRDPMVLNATNHDTTAKTVLGGVTLPAGQTGLKDLNDALDNIFNHPNVGPYIATHLIHCLVTSNPSGAYVERVARTFNDNGGGVRGDLAAVVKAVLLDPEAGDATNPLFGRQKDPVMYMTTLLRPMSARSFNGANPSDGVLNGQSTVMGMDVLRPNTVFSYYPADFLLPGSTTVNAPEFGVFSASTSLRRANWVNTITFTGITVNANTPLGTSLDFSKLQALAADPNALVDEGDRILLGRTMSASMRSSVIQAVNAVAATNPLLRARQAVYLVATSSQFQVQR